MKTIFIVQGAILLPSLRDLFISPPKNISVVYPVPPVIVKPAEIKF